MKKETLALILSAAAVLVLGAGLAALLLWEAPPEPPSSSDVQAIAPVLIEKNNYDLDKIKITTAQGSFTIRHMGALHFRVDELGAAPQEEDLLLSAAGAASSLSALQTVTENAPALSPYGLQSPRAVVQIDYTAPDSLTLLLGDEAPGGAGCYAQLQGSNAVYLLDCARVAVFLRPMQDFITLQLTAFPGYDQRITAMEISGGTRTEPILLTPLYTQEQEDTAAQLTGCKITAPHERESSATVAVELMQSVFGVSADSIAAFLPDDAALEAFGMQAPYAIIRAQLTGEENIALFASAPDAQGSCFLMREGVPVIYRTQASALPWLHASYPDLLSRELLPSSAGEISMLTVTQGEETATFRLTHADDGMKVTLNGRALPPQQFLQIYEKLLAIRGEEYTEDAPPEEAEMLAGIRVSFTDEAEKSRTLRFYDASARRIFIENGSVTDFLCRKSALVEWLDALSALTQPEG